MSRWLSRRGFVVAGAGLILAGCATAAPGWPVLATAGGDELWPELEPLLAVQARPEGLRIRVASQGCATKADFVFRVDRKTDHAVVAFARRRLETCRGPKGAADLVFGYEELGLATGERVVVANRVLAAS